MSLLILLFVLSYSGLLVFLSTRGAYVGGAQAPAWNRWTSWLVILALPLIVLVMPRVALADTGAGASVVGTDVRGGLVDAIVAQVAAAMGLGLKWLWNKVKSSGTARKVLDFTAQHKLAQQIAQDAVNYSNELKHQAIDEGKKLAGKVLQSEAYDYASDLLRKVGLPPKIEKAIKDEMIKIILARLGATRAPATKPRVMPLEVA